MLDRCWYPGHWSLWQSWNHFYYGRIRNFRQGCSQSTGIKEHGLRTFSATFSVSLGYSVIPSACFCHRMSSERWQLPTWIQTDTEMESQGRLEVDPESWGASSVLLFALHPSALIPVLGGLSGPEVTSAQWGPSCAWAAPMGLVQERHPHRTRHPVSPLPGTIFSQFLRDIKKSISNNNRKGEGEFPVNWGINSKGMTQYPEGPSKGKKWIGWCPGKTSLSHGLGLGYLWLNLDRLS